MLDIEQLLALPPHERLRLNGHVDMNRVDLVNWNGLYCNISEATSIVSVQGAPDLEWYTSGYGCERVLRFQRDCEPYMIVDTMVGGWVAFDFFTRGKSGEHVHPGLYAKGFVYEYLKMLDSLGVPLQGFKLSIEPRTGRDTYHPVMDRVKKGESLIRAISQIPAFKMFRKMLFYPSRIVKDKEDDRELLITFEETNLTGCDVCPSKGAECPLRNVKTKQGLWTRLAGQGGLAPRRLVSTRSVPETSAGIVTTPVQQITVEGGKPKLTAKCITESTGEITGRYPNTRFGFGF